MCQLDKESDPTQVLHHRQLIQLETTLATLLSTTGSCLKSTTAEGWLAPVCFAKHFCLWNSSKNIKLDVLAAREKMWSFKDCQFADNVEVKVLSIGWILWKWEGDWLSMQSLLDAWHLWRHANRWSAACAWHLPHSHQWLHEGWSAAGCYVLLRGDESHGPCTWC